MPSNILISNEFPEIDEQFIKHIIEQFLKKLDLDNVEISISFVDNETIQQLNKEWRGKDKPTDVLSFPVDENPPEYPYKILGDIIISIPYAKRQAENLDETFEDEIIRLLAHGLLHLLGYDHEISEEEAKKMFSKEDELIEAVEGTI